MAKESIKQTLFEVEILRECLHKVVALYGISSVEALKVSQYLDKKLNLYNDLKVGQSNFRRLLLHPMDILHQEVVQVDEEVVVVRLIEELRTRLHKEAKGRSFTDPKVLEASQELNIVLNKYEHLLEEKRKKEL